MQNVETAVELAMDLQAMTKEKEVSNRWQIKANRINISSKGGIHNQFLF